MKGPSFHADELHQHFGELRELAQDILRDEHRAEDVVQETFRVALEHGPRGVRSTPGWLRRIARNLALNLKRTERHRRLREERSSRSMEVKASTATLSEGEWIAGLALAAIDGLKEPYRTVLRLRYVEGQTPTRIADELDISINTAKTRLRRGREQLRDELDAQTGDRRGWLAVLVALPFRETVGDDRPPTGSEVTRGTGRRWTLALVGGIAVAVALLISPWKPPFASDGDRTSQGDPMKDREQAREASADSVRAPGPATTSVTTRRPVSSRIDGTLRLQAVWNDDRTPAADVRFTFHPELGWPRGVVEAVTDEGGELQVALPLGPLQVTSDRGGHWTAHVDSATTNELDLVLPPGILVEGTVIDGWEQPLAGARIWLTSSRSDWLGGRFVTTADAHGSFRLRGIDPGMSIGALATGYAPADLVDLDLVDQSEGRARLRLRIDRRGGAVEGTVRDPEGAPVPGARVAIGAFQSLVTPRTDGTRFENLTPVVLRTDASGAFRHDGITPREFLLCVLAEDYPVLSRTLRVAAEETREVTLTLERPATVRGIVRGQDGRVRPGAVIAVAGEGLNREYPDPRTAPPALPFPLPMTRADDEGAFELAFVGSGRKKLVAWAGSEHERATEHLVVPFGGDLEWHPVVDAGLVITGSVFDEDGDPLAASVRILALDDPIEQWVVTADANGDFVAPGLRDTEYGLELEIERSLRHPNAKPEVSARPSTPDNPLAAAVVLHRRTASGEEGSTIVGRLTDDAGRIAEPEGITFWMERTATYERAKGAREGDSFRFQGLPPGSYRLLVYQHDRVIHLGQHFAVGSNEYHDLGDVPTDEGATLVLRLEPEPALALRNVRGFLASEAVSDQAPMAFRDGELWGENLLPGPHQLWIVGEGMAHVLMRVVLEPGEERVLDVPCQRGTERFFEVAGPDQATWTGARIDLWDERDQRVLGIDHPNAAKMEVLRWSFLLAPGRYVLTVVTDTGWSLRQELEFPTLVAELEPRRFLLSRDR